MRSPYWYENLGSWVLKKLGDLIPKKVLSIKIDNLRLKSLQNSINKNYSDISVEDILDEVWK